MSNPLAVSRASDADRRAAALMMQDPEAAARIAARALGSQKSAMALPYWSTIRFATARTGAGPYTFTMTAGVRKAFATKVGGVGTAAGFASTYTVTEADTNLTNENTTRNNETLEIRGIAIEVAQDAPPSLVKHVFRNTAVSMQLGGDSLVPIGRPSFFPGGGGLFGASSDPMIPPSLADALVLNGYATNGNPQAGNYYPLPIPITWRGQNEPADTAFNLVFNLVSGTTWSVTERAAAAGIQAYSALADGAVGTYVDLTVRLLGIRKNARSQNV